MRKKVLFFSLLCAAFSSFALSSCGNFNFSNSQPENTNTGETVNDPGYSLYLNKDNLNLRYPDENSFQFKALFVGKTTNIDDKTVTWSCSEENFATISKDGLLTVNSFIDSSFEVICVSNYNTDVTAKCEVSLTESRDAYIEHVDFNNPVLLYDLDTTDRASFNVVVSKQGNISDEVSWSVSDTSVANIYAKYRHTATLRFLKTGEFNLIATSIADPSKFGSIHVRVVDSSTGVLSINVSVTKIQIDLFNADHTSHAYAEVTTLSDIFSKEVTWTSDNPNVATVDNFGLITGLRVGTAHITATSVANTNLSKSVTINVVDTTPLAVVIRSFKITCPKANKQLEIYNTDKKMSLGISIDADNLTNTSVTWSLLSGSGVVTLDQNGLVTGIKKGTCQIKATLNYDTAFTDVIDIEVVDSTPTITSIVINQPATTSIDIKSASPTLQLTKTVDFFGTGFDAVEWSSSNALVATVDQNGLVTALKVGETYIVCTSLKKSTIKDQILISVVDSAISLTKIVFDKEDTVLYPGESYQVEYTYTSSLTGFVASDSDFKWKTSNSNVATVDTTGKVTVKSDASENDTATITCESAANSSIKDAIVINVTEHSYTILAYMCGSDLESGIGHYASKDINEMLSKYCPDDVNIVIQTGGSKAWTRTDSNGTTIPNDKLGRYKVSGKSGSTTTSELVKLDYLTNASMGDKNTLQSFLTWGLENYPAKKTGVVLWNHGGALRGVCYDENYSNDNLSAVEVTSAINEAKVDAGITNKLEWIGYDACLMGVADIASVNADNFNYMIASEETEPGSGWNYDVLLDYMYNNKQTITGCSYKNPCDTVGLLTQLSNAYYQTMTYIGSWASDFTFSVLDLNKFEPLKTALESFASTYVTSQTNFNKIVKKVIYDEAKITYVEGTKWTASKLEVIGFSFNNLKDNSTEVEEDEYMTSAYCVFDLADLFNQINSKLGWNVSSILSALNDVVIVNKYGTFYNNVYGRTPCGLSFYLACRTWGDGTYYPQYKSYYVLGTGTKFEKWREANISYSGGIFK